MTHLLTSCNTFYGLDPDPKASFPLAILEFYAYGVRRNVNRRR